MSDEHAAVEKPVLGVMPRWRWLELRRNDLALAIGRFAAADKPIPREISKEFGRVQDELEDIRRPGE